MLKVLHLRAFISIQTHQSRRRDQIPIVLAAPPSHAPPRFPHLVMLAYLGATLCLQDYIDQGRAKLNETLSEGRRRSHAHTLSLVLRFATWAAWLLRSPLEEQQYADELLSLSDEHGFPFWAAWAMVHRGSALAELGFAQDCVDLISNGLQIATTIGAVLLRPTGLIVLAEVHVRLKEWANAGKLLDEASLITKNTDDAQLLPWLSERPPADLSGRCVLREC
jgi:hypothetical protein